MYKEFVKEFRLRKAMTSMDRGEPLGTIHVWADGEKYQKVSMMPPVWSRLSSGSLHHAPGGEEHHHHQILSPENKAQIERLHDKVRRRGFSEETEKRLLQRVDEWVKNTLESKYLQTSLNLHQQDPQPSFNMDRVKRKLKEKQEKANRIKQAIKRITQEADKKPKPEPDVTAAPSEPAPEPESETPPPLPPEATKKPKPKAEPEPEFPPDPQPVQKPKPKKPKGEMKIKQKKWPGSSLVHGYAVEVDGETQYYIGQHKDDNGKWRLVEGKDLGGKVVKIFRILRDAKAFVNEGGLDKSQTTPKPEFSPEPQSTKKPESKTIEEVDLDDERFKQPLSEIPSAIDPVILNAFPKEVINNFHTMSWSEFSRTFHDNTDKNLWNAIKNEVKLSKKTIPETLQYIHRISLHLAKRRGETLSEKVLKDYPEYGKRDTKLFPVIENDSNFIGGVSLSKDPKKKEAQIKLINLVNAFLAETSIKFNTSVALIMGQEETGSYANFGVLNWSITCGGEQSSHLLHEIGHLVASSLSSSKDLTVERTDEIELAKKAGKKHPLINQYNALYRVVKKSYLYKKLVDDKYSYLSSYQKKYYKGKDELFARGFEVYMYKKITQLVPLTTKFLTDAIPSPFMLNPNEAHPYSTTPIDRIKTQLTKEQERITSALEKKDLAITDKRGLQKQLDNIKSRLNNPEKEISYDSVHTKEEQKIMTDVEKAMDKILGVENKVGLDKMRRSLVYTPDLIKANTFKPTSQSFGMGGFRGEPIGTIHRHADGYDYQKVSTIPSLWVRVKTGTVHPHPGGNEINHKNQLKDSEIKGIVRLETKLLKQAKNKDEARKILHDWLRKNKTLAIMEQSKSHPKSGDVHDQLDQHIEDTIKNLRTEVTDAREKILQIGQQSSEAKVEPSQSVFETKHDSPHVDKVKTTPVGAEAFNKDIPQGRSFKLNASFDTEEYEELKARGITDKVPEISLQPKQIGIAKKRDVIKALIKHVIESESEFVTSPTGDMSGVEVSIFDQLMSTELKGKLIKLNSGRFYYNKNGVEADIAWPAGKFAEFNENQVSNVKKEDYNYNLTKVAKKVYTKFINKEEGAQVIDKGTSGIKGLVKHENETYFVKSQVRDDNKKSNRVFDTLEKNNVSTTENEVNYTDIIYNVFSDLSKYFPEKLQVSKNVFIQKAVDLKEFSGATRYEINKKQSAELHKYAMENFSEVSKLSIVNLMLGNEDRNPDNIGIDNKTGQLVLLDEGLSLNLEGTKFGRPVPEYLGDLNSKDHSNLKMNTEELKRYFNDDVKEKIIDKLQETSYDQSAVDSFADRWEILQLELDDVSSDTTFSTFYKALHAEVFPPDRIFTVRTSEVPDLPGTPTAKIGDE